MFIFSFIDNKKKFLFQKNEVDMNFFIQSTYRLVYMAWINTKEIDCSLSFISFSNTDAASANEKDLSVSSLFFCMWKIHTEQINTLNVTETILRIDVLTEFWCEWVRIVSITQSASYSHSIYYTHTHKQRWLWWNSFTRTSHPNVFIGKHVRSRFKKQEQNVKSHSWIWIPFRVKEMRIHIHACLRILYVEYAQPKWNTKKSVRKSATQNWCSILSKWNTHISFEMRNSDLLSVQNATTKIHR